MAIVLTPSPSGGQGVVGQQVTVSGTGFTHSGVVNVSVRHESNNKFEVTMALVADVSGNLTGITLAPDAAGYIVLTVFDVTAVASATLRIPVFA